MIPLIKLQKTIENKAELVKSFLYVYCYMNDIKLSDSERTIMSYFILYGIKKETVELIIKSKLSNEDSLKNVMSKLRKHNFIKRVNKTDVINKEFDLNVSGNTIALVLKICVI